MQVLFKSRHPQATDLRDLTERRMRFVQRRVRFVLRRLGAVWRQRSALGVAAATKVAARPRDRVTVMKPVSAASASVPPQPQFAHSDDWHGRSQQGNTEKFRPSKHFN